CLGGTIDEIVIPTIPDGRPRIDNGTVVQMNGFVTVLRRERTSLLDKFQERLWELALKHIAEIPTIGIFIVDRNPRASTNWPCCAGNHREHGRHPLSDTPVKPVIGAAARDG